MALSLSGLKKITTAEAPIALFYGVPGVGKTSLAAEFPDAVWLQFDGEQAPAGVDLDGWAGVKTYEEVVTAIGALVNEEHEFKTLVIDSLSTLEKAVWAETCRRKNWTSIEAVDYGKGYVEADAVWGEIISGLIALRAERSMSVVLLGHTEIVRFESPTSDPYARYYVGIHKRARALIEANVDLIGFINYRIALKKVETGFNKTSTHAEGGGVRIIHVEERPGFTAKNRYNMPPEVTFKRGAGYSELAKYFPGA